MTRPALTFALALIIASTSSSPAQSPSAPASGGSKPSIPLTTKHFVELKFVVKELEAGKVTNTREYKVRAAGNGKPGDHAQIRTGSKVPIETEGAAESTGKTTLQIQYIDVGINFDCFNIISDDQHLALDLTADISSYPEGTTSMQPTIRGNRWSGTVEVAYGKPTTVFSSDDLFSKRTYQVELVVTPAP